MFGGILIYKRILIKQNISKIANTGKEQEKQESLNLGHKVKSKFISNVELLA